VACALLAGRWLLLLLSRVGRGFASRVFALCGMRRWGGLAAQLPVLTESLLLDVLLWHPRIAPLHPVVVLAVRRLPVLHDAPHSPVTALGWWEGRWDGCRRWRSWGTGLLLAVGCRRRPGVRPILMQRSRLLHCKLRHGVEQGAARGGEAAVAESLGRDAVCMVGDLRPRVLQAQLGRGLRRCPAAASQSGRPPPSPDTVSAGEGPSGAAVAGTTAEPWGE
jgi:hypothetical protein